MADDFGEKSAAAAGSDERVDLDREVFGEEEKTWARWQGKLGNLP
jgi:hypothetical protein